MSRPLGSSRTPPAHARAEASGDSRHPRRRPDAWRRSRIDAAPVIDLARQRGLLVNRTSETVVRLLPPLTIEAADIDAGIDDTRCGADDCRHGGARMRVAHTTSPVRVFRSRRPPCGRRVREVESPDASAGHPRCDGCRRQRDSRADRHARGGWPSACHVRREEIAAHASRFLVAVQGRAWSACADLAPLSRHVAEVRSLVVSDTDAHAVSDAAGRRARVACGSCRLRDAVRVHTFAGYFIHMGFSIVPHTGCRRRL